MPLPKTTQPDFARHLDALGIEAGDRLLIHSRLLAFGDLEGGVAAVADLLRRQVGGQGCLIVPCYTFDTTPYDPRTKPGDACGALSEHIRRWPMARRSLCPLHNHAGIGPAAELLERADPGRPLGPGSDFDLMHRAEFKLVLLGCGFTEACTYLHHMEAVMQVPYRHWIDIERQVVDADGTIRPLPVRYFARARPEALPTDFEPARLRMAAAGLLASAPCVFGRSFACRLTDLHRVAADLLIADPYALVGRDLG